MSLPLLPIWRCIACPRINFI